MATLVLTVIGDDRAGLVEALSGVIADNGGNWSKSHMAHLAGKFAGIVMVTLPEGQVEALIRDLQPLKTQGLLEITAEVAASEAAQPSMSRVSLHLVGLDHPGIIHDMSRALSLHRVSIEELETETTSAPMSGGSLFTASAVLGVPPDVSVESVTEVLEQLAHQLMVDIEFDTAANG